MRPVYLSSGLTVSNHGHEISHSITRARFITRWTNNVLCEFQLNHIHAGIYQYLEYLNPHAFITRPTGVRKATNRVTCSVFRFGT